MYHIHILNIWKGGDQLINISWVAGCTNDNLKNKCRATKANMKMADKCEKEVSNNW